MNKLKYDIVADWMLNAYCNLSCAYCFNKVDIRLHDTKYLGHKNIEKIIDFFDNTGQTWLIHMSGGEPFAHPRFIELCQGLTRKNYLSINSNLTLNTVYDFIENIDPKRVAFINCSLHYEERVKRHSIDLFIDKYHKLKKAGFNIFATQVFYPTIADKFGEIFASLKTKKIYVRPKSFRGFYKNKQYPTFYTDTDRKTFLKYNLLADKLEHVNVYQIDPNLDRQFIDGDLSWKGIKCEAGRKFVWINYDGNIVPCHASNIVLGNIFQGKFQPFRDAKECPFTACPCPYYGLTYGYTKPKILKDNYFKYVKRATKSIIKNAIKNTLSV